MPVIARPLALLALLASVLAACGGDPPGGAARAPADGGVLHPLLGLLPEVVSDDTGRLPPPPPSPTSTAQAAARAAGTEAAERGDLPAITVDYPPDGAVFPPGFVPPTFLWHDDEDGVDTWFVLFSFSSQEPSLCAFVPGAPPPRGTVDPEAIAETNAVYEPTPYQASARSWTPTPAVWAEIQHRSREAPATATFVGLASQAPGVPRSRGRTTVSTSQDPVGAPIVYRDVPLMPAKGERGVIQPISTNAIPLIAWRLKDVTKAESRLLMKGMPACGNCHSFSDDGKTFGMDVDGPHGDKGTYAIKPVTRDIRIEHEDVITWNSFPGRTPGLRTIGFLTRISPDGRYAVSTVNEALYVANFLDFRYLQVFYPTRGILAWYDTVTRTMKAVPGADDPAYVHCNAVWSPDGKWLVFSRASAFDPYADDRPMAAYPNDPNEPRIRYDLVRLAFDEGRGGTPVAIPGASANGASNTFPKVSPDGRWIVFTRCDNGQLMRPDGRLWIVPFEGGEARELECNLGNMNSWHSWSPNGRWLVFSSKANTPYTQMFLTHVDEQGHASPAILVPNATAANRAVNIPEFLNAPSDSLASIEVPAVRHHKLFWQGVDLLREGRHAEAVQALQAALADAPDFGRAHANLGIAFAALGRWEEARHHYERALEVSPGDRILNNNLGLALEGLGRLAEAAARYQDALDRDPSLRDGRRNLIRVLLRLGREDAAVVHLQELLELAPDDRESRWMLASLHHAAGRWSEARRELEVLLAAAPDDVRTLSTLAWWLATSSDEDARNGAEALTLAQRAVEVSEGGRPEPLDALAAACAETGRFEQAAAAARRALALLPDRTSTLAQGIAERLALYESERPYRAP